MSQTHLVNLDDISAKFGQIIQSNLGSSVEECDLNIIYLENQINNLNDSINVINNWKNDLTGLINDLKIKKTQLEESKKKESICM